jgi:hypothetical protein
VDSKREYIAGYSASLSPDGKVAFLRSSAGDLHAIDAVTGR